MISHLLQYKSLKNDVYFRHFHETMAPVAIFAKA